MVILNTKKLKVMNQTQPVLSSQPHLEKVSALFVQK